MAFKIIRSSNVIKKKSSKGMYINSILQFIFFYFQCVYVHIFMRFFTDEKVIVGCRCVTWFLIKK